MAERSPTRPKPQALLVSARHQSFFERLQSRHGLVGQKIQHRAAAGRNIIDKFGKLQLLNYLNCFSPASYAIGDTAATRREKPRQSEGSMRKSRILKIPQSAAPEQGPSAFQLAAIFQNGLRPDIQNNLATPDLVDTDDFGLPIAASTHHYVARELDFIGVIPEHLFGDCRLVFFRTYRFADFVSADFQKKI